MHQIGNTFTCFQASIEFHDNDFFHDPNTVSVLGEPALKFAAIHSQSMLNAWYNKLQNCLAEPVQTEHRHGHRRVHVLDTAIFDFAPNGSLNVYAWDFDENNRVMLAALPLHTVVVQEVPYHSLWMNRFMLGAFRALQLRHPGQSDLCKSYVKWAQGLLKRSCWDTATQGRVRYQIAVALDLDVEALAIAGQVQRTSLPQVPLRVNAYNHALEYQTEYATLSREAPQMILLYGLLASQLAIYDPDKQFEVTAALQRVLLENGISLAMWRLLCREGSKWMKEFLAYFNFERQSSAATTIELLLIAQAFGTHQLVAPGLLHAVMQIGGNPNFPDGDYVHRLDDLFALCARLGHLASQSDEAALSQLMDRAHDIFYWASIHLKNLPARYARRATLRGLIRKVDQQQCQEALLLQGRAPWPKLYQLQLKDTPIEAVILNSPLEIWTEGREMRHCADNYISHCECGDWLMVSLRSAERSRPLATVAFDLRNTQVNQIRISGFANTLVTPEVQELARQCLTQLQSQHKRITLKQDVPETTE